MLKEPRVMVEHSSCVWFMDDHGALSDVHATPFDWIAMWEASDGMKAFAAEGRRVVAAAALATAEEREFARAAERARDEKSRQSP